MIALHGTGDLTCPRCGASLIELEGTIVTGSTVGEEFRVNVECPGCDAPLSIVFGSVLPEGVDVDVWVEDRRDE